MLLARYAVALFNVKTSLRGFCLKKPTNEAFQMKAETEKKKRGLTLT